MHLVGKENFARFDALVPGDIFTLDRAKPEALAGLAAGQSRLLSPVYTATFAEHIARPYVPVHGQCATLANSRSLGNNS